MDFEIKKNPLLKKKEKEYEQREVDIALHFSKEMLNEFKGFIKSIVLFGSTARRNKKKGDIDILVIIDDISIEFNKAIVQGYRILTEKIVDKTSHELHITSMRLTNYWEYVRAGDPIAVNILREGIAIMDTGIFNPMKVLLYQGRIKPSQESILNYISRSEFQFDSAKRHILAACIDLYWGVVDAAESALMKVNDIPPGPAHIHHLFEKRFVNTGKLSRKYSIVLQELYHLNKSITHHEVTFISGEQFDKYKIMAEDFIFQMQKIVNQD